MLRNEITDQTVAVESAARRDEPATIVADFEQIFGKITHTERQWLIEKITTAITHNIKGDAAVIREMFGSDISEKA